MNNIKICELRKYILNQISNKKIKDASIKLNITILRTFLFSEYGGKIIIYNDIDNTTLRKFDLSDIDWSHVFIGGKNFTGTNANIDPQTVYDKDMRWGKYPLNFIGKSFEGVKLQGADLKGAINANTFFQKYMFENKRKAQPFKEIQAQKNQYIINDIDTVTTNIKSVYDAVDTSLSMIKVKKRQ